MALVSACFSTKDLYELVSSHAITASRLATLRHSYERGDIGYLFQQTTALQELLLSRNELPLTKHHALVVSQQIVLTARYAALTLVELYLLPLLTEITTSLANRRREEDLEDYFVERGYRDCLGVRKLGTKFVKLAVQIIFVAAAVRPCENILQAETKVPSRFQLAAEWLKAKGVAAPENCAGQHITALRVAFLKDLSNFQPQLFTQFINSAIKADITFKQSVSAPLKKLLDCDDAFVTIPTINVCVAMLSNMTHHFGHKKVYLLQLSYYVRQGDIYAIVVIHNATFIRQIFEEIINVPGDTSISAGRYIFPLVDASLQDKLEFYIEFLKCLQIWAVCLPYNQIGDVSEVAKYYAYLREKEYVFPEMLLLRKVQTDFNACLQAREERNDEILRMIESDESLLTECAKWKSSVVQLSIKVDKISDQLEKKADSQSSHSRLKLQSLIRQATLKIQGLLYEENVASNIQQLKSFQREWSHLREDNLPSSMIEEGDALKKKISQIYPLYMRLKKKSIVFSSFRRKVASIIGFQLSDFALENYDDYEVNNFPLLQSKNSRKSQNNECDKTISGLKAQESIYILGCFSNVAEEYRAQANKNVSTIIHNQQKEAANYQGQKQILLNGRKKFAESNRSSQSNIFSRNIEAYDQRLHSHKMELSLSLKQQRSEQLKASKQSLQNMPKSEQKCEKESKSVRFSDYSFAETEKEKERQTRQQQTGKMNVYQIYQIAAEASQPQSLKRAKLNTSCSFRNNFCLQKIRYSSTRKAIQSYAKQTQRSDSSKTGYNSSRTTSKSIINRQYKRISFQANNPQPANESPSFNLFHQPQNAIFKTFNFQKNSQYFQCQKDQKLLKNCLKNKGILFTNQLLQIGFVHTSTENSLNYTLYLTALKDLTILRFSAQPQPNLMVKCDFQQQIRLKKAKQEVLKLEAIVTGVPFCLPKLELTVEEAANRVKEISFILPNSFNKYLSPRTGNSGLQGKDTVSFSTESFKLSKVHNLHSKLSSFFGSRAIRRLQKSKTCIFECAYKSSSFYIEMKEYSSQSGRFIAHCDSNRSDQLQFLLATLCFTLELQLQS